LERKVGVVVVVEEKKVKLRKFRVSSKEKKGERG
jgi:hypothetical protein